MTARICVWVAAGLLLSLTTGCCRFCERWCGNEYRGQQNYQPQCCVPANPCAPGPYTGGYIPPQACPPQPASYSTGAR